MAKKERYFLHLAYKGTHYNGWQVQATGRSVQGEIERCLSALLHRPVKIHPCGRTDAGVHASQFYAHFNKEENIDFDLVFRINKMLPRDIVVYELLDVPPNANAQLDAIRRTYHYRVHLEKNPFLEDGSTLFEVKNLDPQRVQAAIELVLRYDDFRAMCLTPDAHSSTICRLDNLELHHINAQQFYFKITANRFLRGMIRLLVARLLDVGIGKLTLAELETAFQTGERVRFPTSAPPQGLYLAGVEYDFL